MQKCNCIILRKTIILILSLNFSFVKSNCEAENISNNSVSVLWPQTTSGNSILSVPVCFHNKRIVTRTCMNTSWVPSKNELNYCEDTLHKPDFSVCSPNLYQISQNVKEYCYQTTLPAAWDYPCLKSGGAIVVTDLKDRDVEDLLDSLKLRNISRYFWLPGRRSKIFAPLTWYVAGPKWGRTVESTDKLKISASLFKNCLLLDIESNTIISETCTEKYPSLCFYVNSIYYPAQCPKNYYPVRFMADKGLCLGVEFSEKNLTYDQFNEDECKNPVIDINSGVFWRIFFSKIAKVNHIPDSKSCWFTKTTYVNYNKEIDNITQPSYAYISINNLGVLSILNATASLSCMACQSDLKYDNVVFMFEYNENDKAMHLTVFNPSGLWKYNDDDNGIQCFSDASGNVKVVDIYNIPTLSIIPDNFNTNLQGDIEKVTYLINLVTNRSAQYWCEGHTKNFSLISTRKIVVSPKNDNVYVFALVLELYITSDDVQNNLDTEISALINNIENIFKANKVLVMEILNYIPNRLTILLHLHISIDNYIEQYDKNVTYLYNLLKKTAETKLVNYNYTFRNLSSSMYCLPAFSKDNELYLDWELTPIGRIAAPQQFCLQINGLPVKRLCSGSYLYGSFWDKVEGNCHSNYLPSHTTTFLYKFFKDEMPENYTTSFLTIGLGNILNNSDTIIPADIYYLAMSLQHILRLIRDNETYVEFGNLDNIAWIMDRVMDLNNNYLRLAQTLNSTNVILDTLTNIIELITQKMSDHNFRSLPNYQFAVQPQFIIQVSYPKINHITGIAVARKTSSNLFTDMLVIPLYSNTTLNDILQIDNLEIATWLSYSTISLLKKNTNISINDNISDDNLHIIINVFHNNAMFQELNPNNVLVNSRIIGVTVPGYISNLQYPINLVFKDLNYVNDSKYCGYWELHTDISNIPGYWSNRGCYFKYTKYNLTVCECYHLTHFGQLINMKQASGKSNFNKMEKHFKPLNIISLVGSFISLFGIVVIYVTASLFKKWRKKASTKVLLNLSGSIALPLIFMIIFNLGNSIFQQRDHDGIYPYNVRIVCIVLGSLLHYSVLSSFMWMLITAILQFIRYVRVLGVKRPSRFIMKFTIIGWGIPIIPVGLILIINSNNYVPDVSASKYCICYPNGIYFIFGVILPISLILLINITLYVLVLCAISRGPDGKVRTADIDLVGAQFRLSVFLFFLLGLTWVFGFFSFSNNYIWAYLFCLTSTLQGFVLFVYFIIFDPETRNLWLSFMTTSRSNSKPRESITSISSE